MHDYQLVMSWRGAGFRKQGVISKHTLSPKANNHNIPPSRNSHGVS